MYVMRVMSPVTFDPYCGKYYRCRRLRPAVQSGRRCYWSLWHAVSRAYCKGARTLNSAPLLHHQPQFDDATKSTRCHVDTIQNHQPSRCQHPLSTGCFFKAVFTTERNYDEQTTSSKQNGANVNASWFQVRFFCCQPNLDVCNDRKIY